MLRISSGVFLRFPPQGRIEMAMSSSRLTFYQLSMGPRVAVLAWTGKRAQY